MQAIAALPRVADLGAAARASSSGVPRRRRSGGSLPASGARPSSSLIQQRACRSNSSFSPCRHVTASKQIADPNVVRGRDENVEIQDDEQWRGFIDVESLVQGKVGRMALVATLLLGVGTLAATGPAEAATVHLRDGLHSSLDTDMRALAMGPEGPLLEEFWDNMRRYGLYFLTVASGGIYSLLKPLIDALRNPLTAILVIVVVTGTLYLVGLTVSAMLGITEYPYEYAP